MIYYDFASNMKDIEKILFRKTNTTPKEFLIMVLTRQLKEIQKVNYSGNCDG